MLSHIGGNNKSGLPDGNPYFEPCVVAMDRDGALRWCVRLSPAGTRDGSTGEGGRAVELAAVLPLQDGLLVVGSAPLGKGGEPKGNDLPTRNVPAWGRARRVGGHGITARLHFGP